MEVGDGGIALASAAFAIVGIALLLFFAERPTDASVAEALLLPPNTLLRMGGTAGNVTADRFLLCGDHVCISVRKGETASAQLVSAGRDLLVTGRVKEYLGRRYVEAEWVEMK